MRWQSPTHSEPNETEHRGLPMVLSEPASCTRGGSRASCASCLVGRLRRRAPTLNLSSRPSSPNRASRRPRPRCSRIFSACANAGSRASWCRAPTSSPCSRTSPSANWSGCFAGAGHSRLVVYNDTLDDPIGMVHIRDLVAFMAARARSRSRHPRAGRTSGNGFGPREDRSFHAVDGGQDCPRDSVRAAVDAGARSAGQDAGDAHSPRADHRRVWRQRWSRLDRGSGRAHRRRYRRRA